ncbi:kinesin-like protein KIN-7I isoform X2 [Bradysia coprophila]|uniref:kinesin-like protein KIN-7I isoform X2 n=1 Tax=Bradysia coprophila TaxID=38358 RepID=UPI00187DA03E|nr:kinesin-like protein KIN-7I isoform X2 [Bradysia coprophila]
MSNIKVCVKIRPLSERDVKLKKEEQWKVADNKSLQCVNVLHPCEFTFDHIFGTKCLNYEVYLSFVKPIVDSCLMGFNGTILTYGPTSAGKTFTMLGTDMDPGVILITIERLFKTGGFFYRTIRFGYIEIYKEKIYDLLNDRKQILIDQNDITLSNEEIVVESFERAVEILLNGSYKRKSATEDDSKLSSISHSIFRITIESEDKTKGKMLVRHLTFVHVAGCEPMTKIPISDSLEDETTKSLYWLNVVINELDKGEKNINFNNSILTALLRESLTGTSNTAIICNIRADEVTETASTLLFVSRARNVRTLPMRNEMHNVPPRCSTPTNIKMTHVDNQLKEIAELKVENLLLRKELEEVKATFAARTIWFEEQMKNAEFAQQKMEHEQIEVKTSFERIKSGLKSKIQNLIYSNGYSPVKSEPLHHSAGDSLRNLSESPTLSQNGNSTFSRNVGFSQPIETGAQAGIKRKIERLANEWTKNTKAQKLHCKKTDVVKPPTDRLRPLLIDETESHTTTVPNSLIGRVIGTKGVLLRSLIIATGARISISKRSGDSDRIITINGDKCSVGKAVSMIQQMLKKDD